MPSTIIPTTTTASLPKLPTELISKICDDLIRGRPGSYACQLYGLYGLRLTCRALYFKTFHDLARAAFKTLFVDLSVKSLNKLYYITQHAGFRKVVECVYIGHCAHAVVGLGERREESARLGDELGAVIREGFKKVFKKLTGLRKVVIVAPLTAVSTRRCESEEHGKLEPSANRRFGYRGDLINIGSPLREERWGVSTNKLYGMVIGALSPAGEKVDLEVLEMSLFWPYGNVPFAFGIYVYAFSEQHEALERMRMHKLLLTGCCDGDPCTHSPSLEMDAQYVDMLQKALEYVPKSRELRFSLPGVDTEDGVHQNLQIIQPSCTVFFPHLAIFILSEVAVREDILRPFYLGHAGNLEHFSLTRVDMHAGTWSAFCAWMLEHHNATLLKFLFHEPSDAGRHISGIRRYGRYERDFMHTRPNIASSLRVTLADMHYYR